MLKLMSRDSSLFFHQNNQAHILLFISNGPYVYGSHREVRVTEIKFKVFRKNVSSTSVLMLTVQ